MTNVVEVRASGLLCLLGIGVGLGSMLLYKVYRKVTTSTCNECRSKKPHSLQSRASKRPTKPGALSPETPDSGISTGTTSSFNTMRSPMECDQYTTSGGVSNGNTMLRSRSRAGSLPAHSEGQTDPNYYDTTSRRAHYQHRSRTYESPQDLLEFHEDGTQDQNGNSSEYYQLREEDANGNEGEARRKQYMTWMEFEREKRGLGLKRRRGSFTSDMTDCSHVSYGDSFDGMSDLTDSELFYVQSSKTEINLEEIQNELRGIRQDMTEMNDAFQLLSSQENLCSKRSYTLGAMEACQGDINQWQSSPASGGGDSLDESTNKRPAVDFMWDYQSDLVNSQQHFIAHRPVFRNPCDSSTSSQSSDHTTPRRKIQRTQTSSSITGIFIDDEMTGDFSLLGEEVNTPRHNPDSEFQPRESAAVGVQCDTSRQREFVPEIVVSDVKCTNCGTVSTMNQSFNESCTSSGVYTSDLSLCGSVRGRRSRSNSSARSQSAETLQEWRTTDWEVKNVEGRRNIYEYMETEWPRETEHEVTMKKGYRRVCELLGVNHVRRVRSDLYCSVRAVLFQAMLHNVAVQSHLDSLDFTLQRLAEVFSCGRYPFLNSWTFGNRLPYSKQGVPDTLATCITALFEQLDAVSSLHLPSLREDYMLTLMNQSPQLDLQLLEAVKFLMVLRALDIYENTRPSLTMKLRLFTRPSAATPHLLVKNHLNCIGDSSPAGQVELGLLGLTLGMKIEVVRPGRVGRDDFLSHYPDDGADSFPRVYLLSEDDTHYSITDQL